MWYYKARMYSPTLGRFMQTDPIGYADGMNVYAYVGNDPVNKVDPNGLNAQSNCSRTNCDQGPPPLKGPIVVTGARNDRWEDAFAAARLGSILFYQPSAPTGVAQQSGQLADRCLGRATPLGGAPKYKATVAFNAVAAKFSQHESAFRDDGSNLQQSHWASSFGLGDLAVNIERSRFHGAAPTARGAIRVTFDTGRRVGYDKNNSFGATNYLTVIFAAPIGRDPETGLPIRPFQTAYPGC